MRINVLVFLPGPHRLAFEADWDGDEVPKPGDVVKAMRDDRLIGPDGARVTWDTAQAVLVMPGGGAKSSSVRSVTCSTCGRGTIILAPVETESGGVKWEGSCPRCGNGVQIDDRDL